MDGVTIYYIDDDSQGEAQRYADRIARAPQIVCHLIPPPQLDKVHELFTPPPDLFLIDYDLSMVQKDKSKAEYRGSTLATEIRQYSPDCPIVVITRESIFRNLDRRTRRHLKHSLPGCDEIMLKEKLDDDLDAAHYWLTSVAQGYRTLSRLRDKKWKELAQHLGADSVEISALQEATPPLSDGEWIVTEASHWIRNVVLEFPGILYDSLHAATRLGLSEEAFLRPEIQEYLQASRYDGVFEPREGRWWKGRLVRLAQDIIDEQSIRGPTNLVFSAACGKKFGKEFPQAICDWDGTPVADWVCHILNVPIKLQHSLRYYPDSRPSVMDDARVSFRAIRESPDFQPDLVDEEGALLISGIQNLETS